MCGEGGIHGKEGACVVKGGHVLQGMCITTSHLVGLRKDHSCMRYEY